MEKSRASFTCGDKVKRSILEARVFTPIGEMVIMLCAKGLHMIYQQDDITDENFNPDSRVLTNDLKYRFSTSVTLLHGSTSENEAKSVLDECVTWLRTYFETVNNVSKLAVPVFCTIASDSVFRDRVLMSLVRSVPAGKTITYGGLASLAGSPGAQQAVGSIMAKNPFQLIIPCHRVVKRDRKVGKYSGGCRDSVKVWLLQHEGFSVDRNGTLSSA